jgi:hypothetical protein
LRRELKNQLIFEKFKLESNNEVNFKKSKNILNLESQLIQLKKNQLYEEA